MADLNGYSNGELIGYLDPLPPLPLLTKEGRENRQKSPTRFGEEPKNRFLRILVWDSERILFD